MFVFWEKTKINKGKKLRNSRKEKIPNRATEGDLLGSSEKKFKDMMTTG